MIKKQYEELYNLLKSNKDAKILDILPQITEICSSKIRKKNHITNEKGETIAVFCYYHKKWELLSKSPYGQKKNVISKVNTMCKLGCSAWVKLNKFKKSIDSMLLDQIEAGKLKVEDLKKQKAKLIAEKETEIAKTYALPKTQQLTKKELKALGVEEN